MEENQLYTARVQVVKAMEQGLPWHEAAKRAGLEISQSTAYRLRQRMRQGGELALREGRHGHPVKLRGEVRTFLEQTCRQSPFTPSHEIQMQLAQQFSLRGLCCINARGNTMGVTPRFLLSLGGHSKQAGDEPNLPQNVPFFHATYLPFPHHVHELVSL